jgi:hypothetical protein
LVGLRIKFQRWVCYCGLREKKKRKGQSFFTKVSTHPDTFTLEEIALGTVLKSNNSARCIRKHSRKNEDYDQSDKNGNHWSILYGIRGRT